jgi:hypothetical protein
MRPLLLGEAFSRDGVDLVPINGIIGRRLSEWAGFDIHEEFDCANLFANRVDAEPWAWRKARERWEEIRDEMTTDRALAVLLGRKVQLAVTRGKREYHRRHAVDDIARLTVVTIPHPSGRNLLLNDHAERERCGKTLRAAAEGRLSR